MCISYINSLDKCSNCAGSLVCAMCIKLSQNTSIVVQNGFPPIELRTYYTCFSPISSHSQGLVVLILYFPRLDAPEVYQHVCVCMILLRHVMFMTLHGRRKETMSIPFTERTVLPTWLVLPDDFAYHRGSSIHLQLHTPFSINRL